MNSGAATGRGDSGQVKGRAGAGGPTPRLHRLPVPVRVDEGDSGIHPAARFGFQEGAQLSAGG